MPTAVDLNEDSDTAAPAPTPWRRAIITALAASAIVAIVLIAFLWPTATSKVKDIPVGVVATQQQYDDFVKQATEAADKSGNDLPFDFSRVDSRADAVAQIKKRDVYGAFVLPPEQGDRLEILTAGAASPAVANILTQTGKSMVSNGARAGLEQAQAQQKSAQEAQQQKAAEQAKQQAQQPQPSTPQEMQQALQQMQQEQQKAKAAQQQAQEEGQKKQAQMMGQVDQALQGPKITDVVPLSSDDPQGTGLAVAALPLTIGGIVGGMLISNGVRGTWRRLTSVVLYAVVGGIVMVLILDKWFGFAPAPTFELWGAVTLSLAATVGLIVGLHSMLGAPGLGIGALITMLIGNPLAAAQAPKEFLPGPLGEIGQYFVPGATGSLVRDLSYFPDAPLLHAWLVLAGWVVLGSLFIVIGHHRTGGHGHAGGRPA